MKILRNSIAVAAGLLFAASVFAANATQGKLHLYEPVSVQGKQLAAGNYKVEWNGNGPEVQVAILNGKDTVATVPAKVAPTTTKNTEDGYSVTKEPDGSNGLATIFFHGKTFRLELNQQSASDAGQPGASGNN
jgi:hypothetical protein